MASANISRTVYGYPDEMSLLDGKIMGYFGLDNDNKYLREYVMNKLGGYTYLNADNKYCLEISKYCRDYEEGKADVERAEEVLKNKLDEYEAERERIQNEASVVDRSVLEAAASRIVERICRTDLSEHR